MSISNVNFYSQNKQEQQHVDQQFKLKKACEYLYKNDINHHTFDTQQHVSNITDSIKHKINIHECYINKNLTAYEFTSTFDGLVVHVTGDHVEICTGMNVVVKPLSIVFIGDHIKKTKPATTTISRINNLRLKNIRMCDLTCVDNIKLHQLQSPVTGAKNIKVSR